MLLVELAATDGFHRAVAFPFVQAYLRSRGADVRWVRFGVPATARAGRGEPGIDLADDDRARLRDLVRTPPSSHVLFSHAPAPALVALLDGPARPQAGLLVDQDGVTPAAARAPARAVAALATTPGSLAAFLGLDADPRARSGNLFARIYHHVWR